MRGYRKDTSFGRSYKTIVRMIRQQLGAGSDWQTGKVNDLDR